MSAHWPSLLWSLHLLKTSARFFFSRSLRSYNYASTDPPLAHVQHPAHKMCMHASTAALGPSSSLPHGPRRSFAKGFETAQIREVRSCHGDRDDQPDEPAPATIPWRSS